MTHTSLIPDWLERLRRDHYHSDMYALWPFLCEVVEAALEDEREGTFPHSCSIALAALCAEVLKDA